MSSGWIKFEKALKDDPRVRAMARKLRNACVTQGIVTSNDAFFTHAFFVTLVLGGLGCLWFYADTHVREDDTISLTVDDVNEIVGVQGFAQIVPEDWLEILDAETVKLPAFHIHNGTKAKKKAQTAKRVSRHREKVTLASIKSERKSNADVTHVKLPDRDQTETRPDLDRDCSAALEARPNVSHESDPEWFLDFKLVYPERAGDKNWRGAIRAANARIAEGHHPNEFLSGATLYAKFCEATGKIGTEFTMQAARFLGPSKPFLETWALPKNKAEARLDTNISEMNKFLTEGAA